MNQMFIFTCTISTGVTLSSLQQFSDGGRSLKATLEFSLFTHDGIKIILTPSVSHCCWINSECGIILAVDILSSFALYCQRENASSLSYGSRHSRVIYTCDLTKLLRLASWPSGLICWTLQSGEFVPEVWGSNP